MRTRVAALVLLLPLAACSDDTDSATPPTPAPSSSSSPERATGGDCAARIPDDVFATLGWTATGQRAEATRLGCHREAQQGYVEVRSRTGYDELCATLDRTGAVGPGADVDWLGDRTACAVEPDGGVGQTVVVVQGDGDDVTQVTIAVLAPTPQEKVRAAVAELL